MLNSICSLSALAPLLVAFSFASMILTNLIAAVSNSLPRAGTHQSTQSLANNCKPARPIFPSGSESDLVCVRCNKHALNDLPAHRVVIVDFVHVALKQARVCAEASAVSNDKTKQDSPAHCELSASRRFLSSSLSFTSLYTTREQAQVSG